MTSTLCRLLSFELEEEEEGAPQLRFEAGPRPGEGPADEADDGPCEAVVGRLVQSARADPRASLVAGLCSYLQDLRVPGSTDVAGGEPRAETSCARLPQFPPSFAAQVQAVASQQAAVRRGQRGESATHVPSQGDAMPPERQHADITPHHLPSPGMLAGWLALPCFGADAALTYCSAGVLPVGGLQDPWLSDALAEVRQLDGALETASRRAAAVAAQCCAPHEPAPGNAGAEATTNVPSSLAAAMQRERCRLQQVERLQRALRESGEESAAAAVPGLTPDQERLLDALLGQAGEEGADIEAVPCPYAEADAELAAIDAQLARCQEGPCAAVDSCAAGDGAGFIVGMPPPMDLRSSDSSEDLMALKAGYLRQARGVGRLASQAPPADLTVVNPCACRAQQEAQEAAQRIRQIDAALRALRTGVAAAG